MFIMTFSDFTTATIQMIGNYMLVLVNRFVKYLTSNTTLVMTLYNKKYFPYIFKQNTEVTSPRHNILLCKPLVCFCCLYNYDLVLFLMVAQFTFFFSIHVHKVGYAHIWAEGSYSSEGEKKPSSQFENSQDNKLTHSYYSNEAHYFHIASLKHNLK